MPAYPTSQAATARHVLVTGVPSGIGRVVAERLLADGRHVTGLCRTASTKPVGGLETAQVDATDFARLGRVYDDLDAVDVLVHAAGLMCTTLLDVFCTADGAAMWCVHVDVAAFLADRLVPRMPTDGCILLTGSRTANGASMRSQYAATKVAFVGTTRPWAVGLAPCGITANVIAPGATDTPFLHDPARTHTPSCMPPISRFTAPEEVAAMVAFQAGEYGGAITGQQIAMYGGASLQR